MDGNRGSENERRHGFEQKLALSIAGIIALIGEQYSKTKQDDAKQNRDDANNAALVRHASRTASATIIIAGASLLTFGAAVLQYLVFSAQLVEMHKDYGPLERSANAGKQSAEIAAKALMADQRAWIDVGPPLINKPSQKAAAVDIEIPIRNVGKDPAIAIHQTGIMISADMPKQIDYAPEVWSQVFASVIRSECDLAYPIPGHVTVFPGDKITVPGHWDNSTIWSSLINRQKILIIYGCAGYLTMGEAHFTPYCFYLFVDPQGNWRMASAPIGNDAT